MKRHNPIWTRHATRRAPAPQPVRGDAATEGATSLARGPRPRQVILLPMLMMALAIMALVSCRPAPMPDTPTTTDAYSTLRKEMVEEGIIGLGVTDQAVVAAMGMVPRHAFVPAEYLDQAYENHPLPIGHGQTISQPYIVALMSEQAGIGKGDHVLEIGTGSGYQAAVLAELGAEVYSVEIIRPLADGAAERLADLGYGDVVTRHGDGYLGWPEEAPFDSIIVTAAPDHVPQPLLEQLKVGGIMVIPVGPVGGYQELWRIERDTDDSYRASSLGGVRFVPLVRQEPAPE
jgi:protein-L-isoaspartate(D-aspartate) O-methyltransferase